MISLVIDHLSNLVAAEPGAVLPGNRLSAAAPATAGGLPSISVSLAVDPPRANGIGGYLREGHVLTQSTNVAAAGTSPGFASDLKSLAIAPQPVKRNPSSVTAGFSAADISVRRVTDPANPVAYRLVTRPAAREEFALDAARALIRFGAPQTVGDKLEIVHWNISFRDDIVSMRYSGAATLSIWATSAEEADGILRGIQRKLGGSRETLRAQGFRLLNPTRLEVAESLLYQPGVGSSFPVWQQKMEYRFAFDWEQGGEDSGGVAIREIDVHANDEIDESFTVPGGK